MRKINKTDNIKIIEKKSDKVRDVFSFFFFFWKDKIDKLLDRLRQKIVNSNK